MTVKCLFIYKFSEQLEQNDKPETFLQSRQNTVKKLNAMLQARLNIKENTDKAHNKPMRPFKAPTIPVIIPPLIPQVTPPDEVDDLPPPLPETSPPSTPLPIDDSPLPPPPPSILTNNITIGVEKNEELITELLAIPTITKILPDIPRDIQSHSTQTVASIEIPSQKSVAEIVSQLKMNTKTSDNEEKLEKRLKILQESNEKSNKITSYLGKEMKNEKNKENITNLNNNTVNQSGLNFAKPSRPIETVIITSPDTIPICNVCDTKIVR